MKNSVKIAFLFLLVTSCVKTPTEAPNMTYTFGGGVYIVNEGNFRAGNGSISFFSYDSSKIYNDVFFSANNRPLGDVPNSMAIKSGRAFIVVNNSGNVEIADQNTLKSEGTISKLISPRNISFITDIKAYVTSLYSDSVAIINLSNNSISGYINLRRTSESIGMTGSKAFISNWTGGKEIMVVNTLTDHVIDSIQVGVEPESMVFDRNGMLWVLCNGGYARQNFAELVEINPTTNKVEKTLTFPTITESPSCLKIDGAGQTLYFIDNGVRKMDIAASNLPLTAFIPAEAGQYFYKIAINPLNSDIFVTDAVDFVQQGNLLIYTTDARLIYNLKAGIIPGSICFKFTLNSQK